MGIATEFIKNEVLDVVKAKKVERFNDIIREFSEARMRKISQEIEFWNSICDEETRISDLDKKDFDE